MRGGVGGQRPFGTFPKIHPIWKRGVPLRLLGCGVSSLPLLPQSCSTSSTAPASVSWRCTRLLLSSTHIQSFFQTYETPSVLEFALVLLFETLHTIGTGILFFLAFPGMDSVRALMATNAVCLFPGMLKLFMKEWEGKTMRMIGIGLTVLAILMQLTSLIIWPVINRFQPLIIFRLSFQGRERHWHSLVVTNWPLPNFFWMVGVLCPRAGHLEQVTFWPKKQKSDKSGNLTTSRLWDIKTKMTDGGARSFTYLLLSPIKVSFVNNCSLIAGLW